MSFKPGVLAPCFRSRRSSGEEASDLQGFSVPLSEDDKGVLLQAHNEYRSDIALSKAMASDGRDPQPQASNMRKLVWNDEIKKQAQAHADLGKYEHSSSSARTYDNGVVEGGTSYHGENLMWAMTWGEATHNINI